MTRDELRRSLVAEDADLKARMKLFMTFEDLDVVNSNPNFPTYGKSWYTSKFVNEETDIDKIHLTISRGCGCCPDSPYYATPYVTIEGINLYGTPIRCPMGAGLSNGSGIEPDDNRFKRFVDYGYSDTIVEKIEKYLAENPPIPCYDEDDDFPW